MSQFAKIFDVYGNQVLLLKGRTDDGQPCLDILTEVEENTLGNVMVPFIEFPVEEANKIQRDATFDTFDLQYATELRDHILNCHQEYKSEIKKKDLQ